tara:strand:- start:37 stop:303 length:267 start_codon:yes stop_codon:yes gene_type:complete
MSDKKTMDVLHRLMAQGVAAIHHYEGEVDSPIALIAGIAGECGYAFDICPCGSGIVIHAGDADLFDDSDPPRDANGKLAFGVSEVAEA